MVGESPDAWGAPPTSGWAEVRLLGPLRVRLPDGTLVGEREWRTAKNADLLRWLALHVGEALPVDTLAEGLWPDADETRSRSSLRTALAQLRRVLGPEAVDRQGDALLLTRCWVDVPAFVRAAEETDRHRRAARHPETYTAALEADALYLGDVGVGPGTPAAVSEQAAALRTLHARVLGDAAEAALELSWWRDAVDLATRLLEIDATEERASRVLMLAHAGMGEVSRALAEYERCRRVLADELGVDPSPQTRAAHLRVLRPAPPARPAPPFVGRASERAWLSDALAVAPGGEAAPVVVRGPTGSGRRRLVEAVCRTDGVSLVAVGPEDDVRQALAAPAPAATTAGGPEGRRSVVVWTPDPDTTAEDVEEVLHRPAAGAGLVLVAPDAGERPLLDDVLRRSGVRVLELPPLLPDDVGALAHHLLGGPPTPALVEELHRAGHGQPGPVLTRLRGWVAAGVLVGTSRGVALAPRLAEEGADRAGRRALAQALPRLEGDALEAAQLAALLDDALTPALLAPLLVDPTDPATSPAEARHRAGVALEQLVDLGLLRGSPSGAVWRHPALQDTVRAWVRPAVAQRLHRLVAGRAPLPSARRVQHWLAAGERALACVAAMDAAEECTARDDPAGARTHLLQVCSLGDLPEASPTDRADLYEALGDASTQLRRPQEARSAYRQALDVARAEKLPTADRLAHKLQAASDPRSLDVVPSQDSDATSALSGFGALAGAMGDPDRLERYLLDALELADRRGDAKRAVEVRLQLAAGVALPRRDFLGVHRWVEAAAALATRPTDRLRGVLVRHVTPVLLGGAASAREALDDPAVVAAADPGTPVWWRLASMRLLVAHDLGLPGVEDLLRQLEQRVADGGPEDLVPELAAVCLRVRAEREETDRAAGMAARLAGPAVLRTSPLRQHLARLGAAELHEVDGDHHQAVDLLRAVVDEGLAKGCTLLVPEAAARLVLLEAEHDRDAARAAFEVFDDVVGAKVGGPREEFWRRLSRAAVRAAGGDHDGAVAACEQASQLAGQHGLQVLAARARRQRAGYLRRHPRPHPLVDVR